MTENIPKELKEFHDFVVNNKTTMHLFIHEISKLERKFMLRSDVLETFDKACLEDHSGQLLHSPCAKAIRNCQEAVMNGTWICFSLRYRIGRWGYVRIQCDTLDAEIISAKEFLAFKEHLVTGTYQDWVLEVDMEPFSREFYRLRESESIGNGLEFLNRRLSTRIFQELDKGEQRLLKFLKVHRYRDQQLMLNSTLENISDLRNALRQATAILNQSSVDLSWDDVHKELYELGFEPGWGDTKERIKESMRLLLDILEGPSPSNLEEFLARIPMIFTIAVISPHGYFAQSNVLGRPDTGGQVVYILDQVRALEQEMRERLQQQGLKIEPEIIILTRLIPNSEGTNCNQRMELVAGTENTHILRVPFTKEDGEVIQDWISRFEIWPYLERYAINAERELLAELGNRPDLIIGNYSDGSLVASLLSHRLGVTQCNITHALEKTKHLFSDIYWQEMENQYHFSCQFTADLIAMNSADFIITSTYHEIAGTNNTVGQYESYSKFSLPNLYRVVQGIDIFDPKFNIVSPGANSDIYFPYYESDNRLRHLEPQINQLVYGRNQLDTRGQLSDTKKCLIFTMARLDKIKNIAGFVEWYAQCPELQELANLLIVSGHTDPKKSIEKDEQEQIYKMHRLFDKYKLDNKVRWVGKQLDKQLTGELYRFIADKRGVFVQPALFEAFGLTVIEAMTSGLPTFATCYGGPMEIIEDEISGFHINPNQGIKAAERIYTNIKRFIDYPSDWSEISRQSIKRVEERYTWKLYAKRMMTLARIYGFWKYVTDLERSETQRYIQMFYGLQFKPLAEKLVHH